MTANTEHRSARKHLQKPRQSRRQYTVRVRMNDDELSKLDTVANACGMTRSQVLRFAAVISDTDPAKSTVTVESPDLLLIRQELNAQGINLNQIARKYNAMKRPELLEYHDYKRTAGELQAAHEELARIGNSLDACLASMKEGRNEHD